jgi:hypothetical protein
LFEIINRPMVLVSKVEVGYAMEEESKASTVLRLVTPTTLRSVQNINDGASTGWNLVDLGKSGVDIDVG